MLGFGSPERFLGKSARGYRVLSEITQKSRVGNLSIYKFQREHLHFSFIWLLWVCFLHLDPGSTLRKYSHMSCDPNFFDSFPPASYRP